MMPQSLSNVLLHIVFSTKGRRPWIDVEIEQELFNYIAGTCRDVGCPTHGVGASDDHVHISCTLGRTTAVSALIENVKTSSSKWMKVRGPQYAEFAWQNGYGAFSIGQSQLDDLRAYIAGQREHHRRRSFQEELREMLGKYEVAFDERYVWD
jgi:REP element-mobilizing transposase RayT